MSVFQEIEEDRKLGLRLVFTNGCFDILHVGHLRYLASARELGDRLIVGLNSDASIRRLKGHLRPIVPEEERAELLRALRFIDHVCIFEEDTPMELIRKVKPDVLTKGGDWSVEQIVGADFVTANGGKVLSLPFVEGKSTTNVVEVILERYRG